MSDSTNFNNYQKKIGVVLTILFYVISILFFFGLGFSSNQFTYANESSSTFASIPLPFSSTPLVAKELFPKVVTIQTKEHSTNFIVYSKYAKDIVNEVGMKLNLNDEIIPSPNTNVPNKGKILIIKVDIKYTSDNAKIPFITKYKYNKTKDKDYEKVIQEGINGTSINYYKELYKNDILIKKELIESTVSNPMVERIIEKGTKPVAIHSCSYWNDVVDKTVSKTKNKEKNTWMKYVMLCESGCNPNSETSGKFFGLYQFTNSTFKAYGGSDIFDGYDQIKVVSIMYDLKGNAAHHWPACNRAFERDYR